MEKGDFGGLYGMHRYVFTKRRRTREFALNFAKLMLWHFSEFLAESIAFLFVLGIDLGFVDAQFKLFWSFFAPTGARFAQLLASHCVSSALLFALYSNPKHLVSV